MCAAGPRVTLPLFMLTPFTVLHPEPVTRVDSAQFRAVGMGVMCDPILCCLLPAATRINDAHFLTVGIDVAFPFTAVGAGAARVP